MKLNGTLNDLHINMATGKTVVSFEVDRQLADIQPGIEKLMNKPLLIDASIYREKRSKDANAYFHVLVDKLADKLVISKARCKNDMITSYGKKLYIDDEPVAIKTQIPLEDMREQETMHCKFIRCEKNGDNEVSFYWVYRGSHTYNTKEMAELIDGTVQEAKEQGIETMPPRELERLIQEWEHSQYYKKKNGVTSAV